MTNSKSPTFSSVGTKEEQKKQYGSFWGLSFVTSQRANAHNCAFNTHDLEAGQSERQT